MCAISFIPRPLIIIFSLRLQRFRHVLLHDSPLDTGLQLAEPLGSQHSGFLVRAFVKIFRGIRRVLRRAPDSDSGGHRDAIMLAKLSTYSWALSVFGQPVRQGEKLWRSCGRSFRESGNSTALQDCDSRTVLKNRRGWGSLLQTRPFHEIQTYVPPLRLCLVQ